MGNLSVFTLSTSFSFFLQFFSLCSCTYTWNPLLVLASFFSVVLCHYQSTLKPGKRHVLQLLLCVSHTNRATYIIKTKKLNMSNALHEQTEKKESIFSTFFCFATSRLIYHNRGDHIYTLIGDSWVDMPLQALKATILLAQILTLVKPEISNYTRLWTKMVY